MNISSAQPNCSITSSDTITIDLSSITTDTITLTGSNAYAYTGSSYTISTGAGTGGFIAQDISAIDPNIFTWKLPEEFVDAFPDFSRIQKMCETYPGLKIAYEKFVTTYKLVKDHYDTPEDQRPKP